MASFQFEYDYIFYGYRSKSPVIEYELTEEESESIKIGDWLDYDSKLFKVLLEIFKEEVLENEHTLFWEELGYAELEDINKEYADILRRGGSLDDKDLEIIEEWEKDRWSRYMNKEIVRVA